jgi:hypothetical protein
VRGVEGRGEEGHDERLSTLYADVAERA